MFELKFAVHSRSAVNRIAVKHCNQNYYHDIHYPEKITFITADILKAGTASRQ